VETHIGARNAVGYLISGLVKSSPTDPTYDTDHRKSQSLKLVYSFNDHAFNAKIQSLATTREIWEVTSKNLYDESDETHLY